MKNTIAMTLVLMAALYSISAFATTEMTCTPWTTNTTYTDNVNVTKIDANTLSIKNTILTVDPTYHPKTQANVGFNQYLGNTNQASGWSDNGKTQILFNGKILKFSNVGHTEKFNCK